MKLIYLLVFVSCFSVNVFAQDNSSIPSTSIPKKETDAPNKPDVSPQYSLSKPFVPERFKTAPKFAPISMDKPMQIKPEVSDLNPGLEYQKKLNKKPTEGSSDSKIFRRDQYFGEFTTESSTLKIDYRDFGAVDGDRIRVWVNGGIVADMIQMYGSADKFYVSLEIGINIVEIEAINEGLLTPNTGEFTLTDGDGKVMTSDQWGIATGFKARFNIQRISRDNKVEK